MPALVGLKVKITRKIEAGKRPKAVNSYPDFNALPAGARGNMDWSHYIDIFGTGWHYDKVSGFGETDTENSDPDSQNGIFAAPKAFAVASAAFFPELVEIIEEAEFGAFHDNRAHAHEEDEKINTERLNAIRAKYGLEGDIRSADKTSWDQADKNAVDPDRPEPGITKNHNKAFADMKAKRNITLLTKAEVEV